MARYAHRDWSLPETLGDWTQVQVAVLMDIRDELKKINSILYCPNFTGIPRVLKQIRGNTTKKRRRK